MNEDRLPINKTIQQTVYRSETSKCRERLKKYCTGYGLDLGCGGDPIIPSAITLDLPSPYTQVGTYPYNLGGDARDLFWFRDNTLDYVYSSHLLEDFEDTEDVLREWLRVIKPGGYLILFCPDEQVYRKHCQETGQPYNLAHKIENFSLDYLKHILERFNGIEIIHENPLVDTYSFELVIRKISETPPLDQIEARYRELRIVLHKKDAQISQLEKKLEEIQDSLKEIHNSAGWQMLCEYYKIRDKFFPPSSWRRKVYDFLRNLLRPQRSPGSR